jgi:hypothetical protein
VPLLVDGEWGIGTGLFFPLVRSRSVMELGAMGGTYREEEDDVTKDADTSNGAKISIARSSHGSVLDNEDLPPRRFVVAASS